MNLMDCALPRTPPADSAPLMQTEVMRGLRSAPKQLPSKFFYDAAGSALFERICALPEYYLTRTEIAIMQEHGAAMAAVLGADVELVEFGSGSGIKTRLLLGNLERPAAYVPVEISASALADCTTALARDFPALEMLPVLADFTRPVRLPVPARSAARTVVYFPGSTLGNFDDEAAHRILRTVATEIGPAGGALIGIDLKKPVAALEAAYNDAAGVTAAFTLNMLARFNRELGADFDLTRFAHRAVYSPERSRIETHIVSLAAQRVSIGGAVVAFQRDEAMLVEISCKYSVEDFQRMCRRASLRLAQLWTDRERHFAVAYVVPAPLVRVNPS